VTSVPSTLGLDGDILVFQACAAVEKEIPVGDFRYLGSSFEDARGVFYENLHDLMEQANTEDLLFTFSDKQNWRRNVFPDYKANRRGSRKPLCYQDLVDYVSSKWPTVTLRGLEADDVLGIYGSRREIIIWSIDKDLKQIPGYHLGQDEVIEITKEEGDRFHLYQTLVGDPTDGYAGCPGVGPKGANEFLDSPYEWSPPEDGRKQWRREGTEDTWRGIESLFEKAGLTSSDALVQARVSRILRDGEYDMDKQKVRLWKP